MQMKVEEMLQDRGIPMQDISANIPGGDMPKDQIKIEQGHMDKADVIYPRLVEEIQKVRGEDSACKVVVTVCGGSGVGKSEIASLLSFMMTENGMKSYTLSGDNYPHRIPKYNDAERLRVFRAGAIRKMVEKELLDAQRFQVIQQRQKDGVDADVRYAFEDWYGTYLEGGREGLQSYLGTPQEINFEEVERILREFKDGKEAIWLKRMGRDETELWYEKVDMSDTQVLIIEWTHGNSDNYSGVDIPILLNSTPQETLEHRRARNRDGGTDSPFTMLVLELEQRLLHSQAHKAKIIITKSGELVTYDQYSKLMEGTL